MKKLWRDYGEKFKILVKMMILKLDLIKIILTKLLPIKYLL